MLCILQKKDPEYLRESGRGKKILVNEGIYPIRFFPDSLDFFVQAAERGIELATTSKGGIDFVEAVYNTRLPQVIKVGGKEYAVYSDFLRKENGSLHVYSTSSAEFTYQDKTDPRCYFEFVIKMLREGRLVLSYTSDDPAEAAAALKCSGMLKKSGIPLFEKGIAAIHIPVELHKNQINETLRFGKAYQTDTLSSVVRLSSRE